jgi:hypothetical protein
VLRLVLGFCLLAMLIAIFAHNVTPAQAQATKDGIAR